MTFFSFLSFVLLIILFIILLKSNETKARIYTKACHLLLQSKIPWMWCGGVCQHWLLLALRSGCILKVNTAIVSLSVAHLLFCVFICITPLFPKAGVSRKHLSNPAHLIPAYIQWVNLPHTQCFPLALLFISCWIFYVKKNKKRDVLLCMMCVFALKWELLSTNYLLFLSHLHSSISPSHKHTRTLMKLPPQNVRFELTEHQS